MTLGMVFYALAAVLLLISFLKDRAKTKEALMKAWKSFSGILPQFLAIIVLVGILLAVFSPETINSIIGESSGWFGVFLASIIGSVTLIPGFIAFPTAAMLLKSGAGYTHIAAFLSTLMSVGIVTLPTEIRYFGRRFAVMRNAAAYVFAWAVAIVVGLVMGG